jgi:hypothetical protein
LANRSRFSIHRLSKEFIMQRRLIIAATLAAVILSTSALAQGPRYRFNQTNTPGW